MDKRMKLYFSKICGALALTTAILSGVQLMPTPVHAQAAPQSPVTLTSDVKIERAETDDPIWNAAQRQLRQDGVIQNYLRMLWGKRVLTWTRDAREALDVLIHLNNRWALDGRDPNSYGGIFWCLGRYDRGWPERDIFGVVRSMTSDSTRRKLDLDAYLARYGARQATLFE